MRLADFIERACQAPTPEALTAEFKRALSGLGYDYCACAAPNNHELYHTDLPPPAVLVDYPQAWQDRYAEQGYLSIDPVVSRGPLARVPFIWDDLPDLRRAQRRMFAEASDAGLRHGVVVPVHGPSGEVFIASIVSGMPDVDPRRDLPLLNVITTQFHTSYASLRSPGPPPAPPTLTRRERECLLWSARGKSSWDISMILSLSECTVTFHMKNAMAKLDSGSRIMAIVKAIRTGIIVP